MPGLRSFQLLALGALLLAGCVRSVGDIPAPGEGAIISGRVVERDAKSGELVPFAGARATITTAGVIAYSDERGVFRAQRIPLGKHRLMLEEVGPNARGKKRIDGIEAIVDGQTIELGDIPLNGTGDITGTVKLSDRDAVGAAEGALVVATGSAYRSVVGQDGSFALSRLPEGSFDLAVFRAGYAPGRVLGISVGANEQRQIRSITLEPSHDQPPVSVGSKVRLAGQTDHSGVAVVFLDEVHTSSVVPPVMSASDGSYQLTVPPGIYRVRFTKTGYAKLELSGVAVLPEGVLGLAEVTLRQDIAGDEDGDGIPDAMDPDRDNDGCLNEVDAFPDDPYYCKDSDHDGIPDELDPDNDNDGLSDAEELSPGVDGWITNPFDPDTDHDGVDDRHDNCPLTANPAQEDADHDGVGDACSQAPLITDFFPKRAGAGVLITLVGHGFNALHPEFNLVRFGRGISFAAPGRPVTEDHLEVPVPPEAESGRLQLLNGRGLATSSVAFEFIEPPVILEFGPKRSPVLGQVTVRGLRFSTGHLKVRVNGVEAPISAVTSDGTSSERFLLTVPSTTDGLIEVETDGGTAHSAEPLRIIAPPAITSFSPNPAVAGLPVLILGQGLAPANLTEPVRVDFLGAPSVRADSVTDTAIRVTVPSGARTGTVGVTHSSGHASSADALVIDPMAPAIGDIEPSLVKPGESLKITGGNLAGVTEVRFDGTPGGVITRTTGFELDVTVPMNVRPGAVSVRVGARTATSPIGLSVLETSTSAAPYPGAVGLGYIASGSQLALLTPFPLTLAVLDGSLSELTQTTFPSAALNTMIGTVLTVAPSGQAALLTAQVETWVVNFPSLAAARACIDAPDTHDVRFVPGSDQALAMRNHTILRVDLASTSCDHLDPGLGPVWSLMPVSSQGELLLSGNFGFAKVLSAPGTGLDGTVTTRPVAATTVSLMYPDPVQPGLIWTPSGYEMSLLDPFARPALLSFHMRGTYGDATSFAALSAGGRWLFLSAQQRLTGIPGDAMVIFDLTHRRIARAFGARPSTSTIRRGPPPVAAHPLDPLFATTSADQVVQYRIREAP